MTEQSNKKWKREFSAGGVVFKKENDRVFVLMINPKGRNYGPAEDYWSFPKGHIEKGETPEQAATREIKEETGIISYAKKKLEDIKYTFKWGEDNVFKIVSYYLMGYVSGEPAPNMEVANVEWVEISEAEQRLKFKGDKEVFNQAMKALNE